MNQQNQVPLNTFVEKTRQTSPFVPIKPQHRLILISIIAIEIASNFFRFVNSDTPAYSWASVGALLQTVLLYLPLFFYRPSYGWFHPLLFPPIYGIARNLPLLFPRILTFFVIGPANLVYVPTTSTALTGMSLDRLAWLNAFASLMSILSLVCYYLGYFCCPTPKTPQFKFQNIRNPGFKTTIVVLICAAIFLFYLRINGGLAAYIVNTWSGSRNEAQAGEYYWGFIINFGMVACLLWLALEPKVLFNPLFWTNSIACLGMLFIFSGSRGAILYPLITGIIILMLRRRHFSSTKVLAILLVCVLGIGILGTFRTTVKNSGRIDLETLTDVESGLEQALGSDKEAGELTGGRKGGPLPIYAYVPERKDYLYGATYLAAITIPVPRALWPEKPGLCGGRASKAFYNNKATWAIPCGPLGEAYWNFGIYGIIGVFLIYGWLHKWLVKWYRRQSLEPITMLIFAVIIVFGRPDTNSIVKLAQYMGEVAILVVLWGGLRFGKKNQPSYDKTQNLF